MKNELNLFIMSAKEAVRWYKPKSKEEAYLLELISNTKPSDKLIKENEELKEENDDYLYKIHYLEDDVSNLTDENSGLNAKVNKLEDKISDLEVEIETQTIVDNKIQLIGDVKVVAAYTQIEFLRKYKKNITEITPCNDDPTFPF